MIFFLYIVPAFWIATLVAQGMGKLVVWGLVSLPISISIWFSDIAFLLLIFGSMAAVVGNLLMAWEQLSHKNIPRNIDTFLCYFGAFFVQIAFITSPEWVQIGTVLALFLVVPNILFYIVRVLCERTDTLLGTGGFFIVLLFILAGITWFVV